MFGVAMARNDSWRFGDFLRSQSGESFEAGLKLGQFSKQKRQTAVFWGDENSIKEATAAFCFYRFSRSVHRSSSRRGGHLIFEVGH